MATDPAIRDHQTWIGYLQPDGLVVSAAALVDSQVTISRNVAPLQQDFQVLVDAGTEKAPKQPEIRSLAEVLTAFLQWPRDLLHGVDGKPIPESLKTPLREFGETLEPDFAFEDPQPTDSKRPWMILLQDLPSGTDLDAPVESAQAGWSASRTRRFERLLRETGVPIGLISNRTHLRLVYAPRGENAGTLTFPVGPMTEVAGRPILSAFYELLRDYTLLSAPSGARLPDLLKKSRQYQSRVSAALAQQVLDALYELLRGFQAANEYAHGELLHQVLAEHPDQVYWGNLTVLLRLVFLLYAEDQGMMPGSDLYVRNYAVHGLFEKLRNDAEHYPDTMDHRYGAWAQLLALFQAVFQGCSHPHLKMPAREGHLFNPDRYPFLEGRTCPNARMPLVSDGVVFRVLHKLLILDGERLSYRTLDVEQIGSVYQTMMGFRLELTSGQTIALKPAKAHGAPVPVNLEALLAAEPGKRAKLIQDQTDYKLTATMDRDIKAANNVDDLLVALERRIARTATPHPVPAGAMVLLPTDERRKTGSHYTPRSLTEPIVAKALEPVLNQLGEHPTPEDILDLKVCDPAMGSGAFLVETCRQLADHLVAAWAFHGYKPHIPEDEDEVLFARRLIAQRCIYGVDRNPMAVDLAKLSLWLATLAKDHPFTFLDHSLRSGDALVGLTRAQIAHFNLSGSGEPTFVQGKLHEQMTNALRARRQILAAGDDMPPAAKAEKLMAADEALEPARLAGDLFVASFFDGSKSREREENRDAYLGLLGNWKRDADTIALAKIQAILSHLRSGKRPVTPFHWEIEFPEVFDDDKGGFDTVVGNPPFMQGRGVAVTFGESYRDWLLTIFEQSKASADLVSFFFRRAFGLLRGDRTLGLIATKTISKGDTRSSGLRWICTHGGKIYSVRKRYKWPDVAAVVVSIIHITNCESCDCEIDGIRVPVITAFLFSHGGHDDPEPLSSNRRVCFNGCSIYGVGFTFDDEEPRASSLATMQQLVQEDPRNTDRIRPFLGGVELNRSPTQAHSRWVIYFGTMSLEEAKRWPSLLEILELKVRPERQTKAKDVAAWPWWQFWRQRPELMNAIAPLQRMLAVSFVGEYLGFVWLPIDRIVSHNVGVFADERDCFFCVLQSRIHEVFATQLSSGLEDRQGYRPSDGFEPFPFPLGWEASGTLAEGGKIYNDFRAALMVRNNEGLTATYSRFHDPAEQVTEIFYKLRGLHDTIDRMVLEAYGWGDIEIICGFGLDHIDVEDDELPDDIPEELWWPTAAEALDFANKLPQTRRRLPWRYRWPERTRDEVLGRLLELNIQRAEEERRTGQAAATAERKNVKRTTPRRRKKQDGPTLIDMGEEDTDA